MVGVVEEMIVGVEVEEELLVEVIEVIEVLIC